MEIFSQELEDSQLLLNGLGFERCSSQKSIRIAQDSLQNDGLESQTSETFEQQTFWSGEEELMFSLEDSHASRSVLPASSEAQEMTETSGRQCAMLSQKSGLFGSFVKTCLESLAWGNSSEFVWIWNTSVTKHNRLLFQLTPLEQSTDGSGCSLLPTPIRKDAEEGSGRGHHLNPAADMKAGTRLKEAVAQKLWRTPNGSDVTGGPMNGERRLEQGHQLNLQEQAATPKLWPTPTSSPSGSGGNAETWLQRQIFQAEKGQDLHLPLAIAAKLWPTPTVPNGGRRNPPGTSITGKKPDGGKAQIDLREFAIRLLPTPTVQCGKNNASPSQHNRNSDPLDVVAAKMSGELSGSLNPRFVEELMGFPIDHTALKPSGTPSSRNAPTPSLKQYG